MSGNQKPNQDKEKITKTKKQWIIENVISFGLALLLVFMIRSSVIEAFKIPSGSMIPTLLVGDHVFVNKFSYGVKVPFSDFFFDEPFYLYKRQPPKRGEIIVFIFPDSVKKKDQLEREWNEKTSLEKVYWSLIGKWGYKIFGKIHFIKRVIGLPGDKVEVHNKELFVNDQKIVRESLASPELDRVLRLIEDSKYNQSSLEIFHEKLDSASPVVMFDKNNYATDEFGPITVPADHLFVMGDNRDNSNDSRFWGFVPMENVKGRAMVIWLSMWVSIPDSQYIFRPSRIGTVLH